MQSVSDPTLLALVLTPPRQKPKALSPDVFPPPTTADVAPASAYTPPASKPLQGKTIIVDAGHGGYDNGAGGTTTWEKNYTLDIARRLQRILAERGANALLTRNGDYFVTLQGRVDFANSRNADLFISIHMNSSPSKAANGSETFFYTANSQFLAREIHREFVGATGRKSRGVSQARFFVIRKTWMPSVLLECAFVSNLTEEKNRLRSGLARTRGAGRDARRDQLRRQVWRKNLVGVRGNVRFLIRRPQAAIPDLSL